MVGTPREGIDESIANVTKYRTDDAVEKLAGKLVFQTEFDLAGALRERLEMPIACEQTKWSIDEPDTHERGRGFVVLRREMRLDAQIIDM